LLKNTIKNRWNERKWNEANIHPIIRGILMAQHPKKANVPELEPEPR